MDELQQVITDLQQMVEDMQKKHPKVKREIVVELAFRKALWDSLISRMQKIEGAENQKAFIAANLNARIRECNEIFRQNGLPPLSLFE